MEYKAKFSFSFKGKTLRRGGSVIISTAEMKLPGIAKYLRYLEPVAATKAPPQKAPAVKPPEPKKEKAIEPKKEEAKAPEPKKEEPAEKPAPTKAKRKRRTRAEIEAAKK